MESHDAVRAEQLGEVGESVEAVRAARASWHPLDIEAKAATAAQVDPHAIEATFDEKLIVRAIRRTAITPMRRSLH